MTALQHALVDSPVGILTLIGDDTALTGLWMTEQRHQQSDAPPGLRRDDAFPAAQEQLTAYFTGQLTEFDLPLAPAGTAFQQQVWSALRTIPYGHTVTYGTIAADVGQPHASRAVGLANGRNPIGIIVPCHRVVGADGRLVGYGGGLPRKRWLLDHESGVRQGRLPVQA